MPWLAAARILSFGGGFIMFSISSSFSGVTHTGSMVLRTGHSEKTLYKIEFWVYEKILPGFEEISTHRIQENLIKNRAPAGKYF